MAQNYKNLNQLTAEDVINMLRMYSDPLVVAGRQRYGINSSAGYGVTMPQVRLIAKKAGIDHTLALELWKTGIHEARLIAPMVADPKKINSRLMDQWMKDFDSWDVVDGACSNYFRYAQNAYETAAKWTARTKEYEKRAGFSLMCSLAVHDKKAPDEKFELFFPYIYKNSGDNRNFVRKSVNWALRQIGKRNVRLCRKAITVAKEIRKKGDPSSLWIASGALKELETYLAEGKIRTN